MARQGRLCRHPGAGDLPRAARCRALSPPHRGAGVLRSECSRARQTIMSDCCAPRNGGKSFDLAVVGAGSAGFSAAITAAEQGAQVALIGHGTIGGTCVNIGCVPSKTLIRAVETVHQSAAASRFAGIRAEATVTDWKALIAQKDEL